MASPLTGIVNLERGFCNIALLVKLHDNTYTFWESMSFLLRQHFGSLPNCNFLFEVNVVLGQSTRFSNGRSIYGY